MLLFLKDPWQDDQWLIDFVFPISPGDRAAAVNSSRVRHDSFKINLLVKLHRISKEIISFSLSETTLHFSIVDLLLDLSGLFSAEFIAIKCK